jgi:hypothetical protein
LRNGEKRDVRVVGINSGEHFFEREVLRICRAQTTFVPVLIAWLLRTKDVVYFSYSDPNNQASSGELGWGGRNCKSLKS